MKNALIKIVLCFCVATIVFAAESPLDERGYNREKTESLQCILERRNVRCEGGRRLGLNGEFVRELVRANADPNVQTKEGDSALYAASYYNHPELVIFLLNSRADPNKQLFSGYTALHTARCRMKNFVYCGPISRDDALPVAKALLLAKADIAQQDEVPQIVALHAALSPIQEARVKKVKAEVERYFKTPNLTNMFFAYVGKPFPLISLAEVQ